MFYPSRILIKLKIHYFLKWLSQNVLKSNKVTVQGYNIYLKWDIYIPNARIVKH